MEGGPTIQALETIVEEKTLPTFHQITNPPIRQGAAVPTEGLAQSRSPCLKR